MTKPTPGGIVYTDLYPMGDQVHRRRTDRHDPQSVFSTRSEQCMWTAVIIQTSGERTHEGHSIGRWEGDLLAVDTTNFSDNRSPYQNGIPSGAQKRVVERYRLHEEGTRLTVEFTLEDPEYIAGSMTHTRDLLYSPHLEMTPFNCDPEATRRYLP